jgi:hypothetical protein
MENEINTLISNCVKLSNVSNIFHSDQCSKVKFIKSNEECFFNYCGIEYKYIPSTGICYNQTVYEMPKCNITLNYCNSEKAISISLPVQSLHEDIVVANSSFNVIDEMTGFCVNSIDDDKINIKILTESKLQKNINFFVNPSNNFLSLDDSELNSIFLYSLGYLNDSKIIKDQATGLMTHKSVDKSMFMIDLLDESNCYNYSGVDVCWTSFYSKGEISNFQSTISEESCYKDSFRYIYIQDKNSSFDINNEFNSEIYLKKCYNFQYVQPICIQSNFKLDIFSSFVEDTECISSGVFNMKYNYADSLICKIKFISPEFTKIESIFWLDGYGVDKVLYKQAQKSNDGYLYGNVAQINFNLQNLNISNTKEICDNKIFGRICINIGGDF